MVATSQPISISQSRPHASYAWTAQSPMSVEGGSASSISVHPAPIFLAGSFGSVGSLGGTGASFGSRFYPACSPGQIMNPLDPNDFKCRISSSIESEHGQLIRSFNGDIQRMEDELCRNYTCCGQPLNDFHALVDHFEETHVVVVDHNTMNPAAFSSMQQHAANMLRSSDSSLAGALGNPTPTQSNRNGHTRNSLSLSMTGGVAAFDPDDMELDVDSPASSSASSPESSDSSLPNSQRSNSQSLSAQSSFATPPDTPLLSTPISPFASSAGFGSNGHGPYIWGLDATYSSLAIPTGPAAFETTAVHLPPKSPRGYSAHSSHSALVHPYASTLQQRKHSLYKLQSFTSYPTPTATSLSTALNGYAGYSDYSSALPGTIRSGSSTGGVLGDSEKMRPSGESSIPPSLLFSASSSASGSGTQQQATVNANGGVLSEVSTPMTTPAQSRAPSPTSALAAGSSAAAAAASSEAMKEASGSGAGRQGRASNAPQPTASTTLSRPAASLLLNKPFKCPKPGCMKSYKQANGLKYHMTHGQCNFNPPAELASVEGLSEREAERKLRPFCCQVPPCQRRYKNMNGLRYHYQHSGDHGAIGLALLQSGNHDATKSQPSPPSISLDTTLAPVSPSAGNTPTQTPLMTTAPHSTFSAPPTPAVAQLPQLPQMQYMTQSQPASAYASPWGSRCGSPFGGVSANGAQQIGQQVMVAPLAQRVYSGLTNGQWSP